MTRRVGAERRGKGPTLNMDAIETDTRHGAYVSGQIPGQLQLADGDAFIVVARISTRSKQQRPTILSG